MTYITGDLISVSHDKAIVCRPDFRRPGVLLLTLVNDFLPGSSFVCWDQEADGGSAPGHLCFFFSLPRV